MPSLPLLLEGRHLTPQQAKANGLIHEVVPAGELLAAAKKWLTSPQAKAVQPWDEKSFKVPGGAGGMNPNAVQTFIAANAMTRDKTFGNYPAAQAILSASTKARRCRSISGSRSRRNTSFRCFAAMSRRT